MAVFSFVREFAGFLFARKKYWLAPVIILTLLIGGLLVLAQSSTVAPLVYTIF